MEKEFKSFFKTVAHGDFKPRKGFKCKEYF